LTTWCSLAEAVERHVRPGDAIHVAIGHSRWSALLRELARQHWQRRSRLTLQMASLSSLGAVLFRSGCIDKVVTVYSGDSFPSFTPNPVFQEAYGTGDVKVENWSFLTYIQRLRAAATGLPAAVTTSLVGSSMAEQDAYHEVDTSLGRVALVEPLVPDIAMLHAAVADHAGNLAIAPPSLEGYLGAFAARRGVVATVDRVVEDLSRWSSFVRIPAYRVLAAVECPFGAHPGGVYPGTAGARLPLDGYEEDRDFWIEARNASRRDDFDSWIAEWILGPTTHDAYLQKLGPQRLERLVAAVRGERRAPQLPDASTVPSRGERAATWAAQLIADRIIEANVDVVLAGAGLANLAAWVAVDVARTLGSHAGLVAELGLWNYQPVPGDPMIFNFANFPTAVMLSDTEAALGTWVNSPTSYSIACVGAAQIDKAGNVNTTLIPDGAYLVGSGGGNDVITNANEAVVVTTMMPGRFVDRVPYITSPGARVSAVVTDVGILSKRDGELVLTSVPLHSDGTAAAVQDARSRCGWDLRVAPEVGLLPHVSASDVLRLRTYDPQGVFLGRPGAPTPAVSEME
jgi:acyl CoA:acetate/3-ketoacid CoA transferase alpha subunit/acyl CoA:acetate/3-ketoacid CoA transferase beta subunit